ncbi:hypothetical protein VE01_02731 [Pseudogymnoascus verrucosus]|uniref:CST complex subunit Stn1 N-terminal domain-containing protein n=1 Tax=Pseudogymnoascus verrucosus TaxID=342668 RepID=A0A1B8GU64_9PEZI|nr:uncharacterized protein VE01_02731 [Pseudogymnoascus verrucosus]OBT99369.1 hypothetical protein VE01_02731 [Pseudogymnoascus verrucosus]
MTTPPALYPSHCHGLSPTLGRWCPLRAVDVFALREVAEYEGQGIYFHLNHPIKWVRLTGIIVAMDEFYSRVCITIDDGSGATIEATCLAPPRPEATATVAAIVVSTERPADDAMVSPDGPKLRGVDIGKVVKVKGGIREFRGVRQLAMKAISILGDTRAEVGAWREGVRFREEVLRVPWVVTAEEERRCREEAEGERWRVEEEERRKRRRERRAKREKDGDEGGKERKSRVEKENAEARAEAKAEEDAEVIKARSEKEKKAREEREKARRARAIQRLVSSRPDGAGKYAALGF